LAFSILVMIDGGSCGICGFDLIPHFHPDDPEYLKNEGENWYPTCVINDEVQLHEMFNKAEPVETPQQTLQKLVANSSDLASRACEMAGALEQLLWCDGEDTEHNSDTLGEIANITKRYGFGPRKNNEPSE
jgi:hypothetical protein